MSLQQESTAPPERNTEAIPHNFFVPFGGRLDLLSLTDGL